MFDPQSQSNQWEWNQTLTWSLEWYWSQDWGWNQKWVQGHGSVDAASWSWDPAGWEWNQGWSWSWNQGWSWNREWGQGHGRDDAAKDDAAGLVPKHSPPERGCRTKRRRPELDEQVHRNLCREAVLRAPLSDAPLWERLVKSKQSLTRSVLPGFFSEVEGYVKAATAATITEGRPVTSYTAPPLVVPWIVESPPARIAQLSGLPSSRSVGRGTADALTGTVPAVPIAPLPPRYMGDRR
jgi:hypothetical protein